MILICYGSNIDMHMGILDVWFTFNVILNELNANLESNLQYDIEIY
jgi:hypothetical protein